MRLRVRLSLLFCAAILIGSAASLALVRSTTENLFRSFVFSGDAAKAKIYATILSKYYRLITAGKGSRLSSPRSRRSCPVSRQQHARGRRRRILSGRCGRYRRLPYDTIRNLLSDRIAVSDLRGVVVADTSGKLLGSVHPARHLAHGVPITVDFAQVGTVLVGSMVDSSLTGINEVFLASAAGSILWATLGASLIALFMGLLFAAA